jgi:non-ribosomal peptide synthase protein (TIGR01720 family)
VGIREVLLVAYARSLIDWAGKGLLPLDLEGHGREAFSKGIDLTRTVGWFTTIAPVMLRLDMTQDWPAMLQAMRVQLQSMPNGGLGYGVLRYLRGNTALGARLRALPQREICFNYFGQLDQATPAPFRTAGESSGPWASQRGRRPHLLRVDGQVEGGRLQFRLQYSANRHYPGTIQRLGASFVSALRGLLQQRPGACVARESQAKFLSARLNRAELNKVAKLLEAGRTRQVAGGEPESSGSGRNDRDRGYQVQTDQAKMNQT